jgi:asparaginyl-tRNA synthetase
MSAGVEEQLHSSLSNRPDLEFIVKMIDAGAIERLQQVADTPFERVTYTEAVDILQTAIREKKKKFQYKVEWGVDLQSEHERYLTEEVFKKPTIVYNYPKGIKAFYMRINDDNETVAAMDVLVPKVRGFLIILRCMRCAIYSSM